MQTGYLTDVNWYTLEQVLPTPYGLLGRLDSACVSEASDLCSHTYTRTDKVKKWIQIYCVVKSIFILRAWQTVSFPPKYRCTDELWDNQKTVVLKRIIWSCCAYIFRTCPWPYGSQNSTNATQSNCACSPIAHAWIIKNEINKKGFCGPVKVELSFWKPFSD